MEIYTFTAGDALRRKPPQEIEQRQLGLLRSHLRHALQVPFYAEHLAGLDPDSIRTAADLTRLPFTTRHDVDSAPHLFALPDESRWRDLSLTSGTTGEPMLVPYTEDDLTRISYNEEMACWSAGVRPGERVLTTITADRCFVAGYCYVQGLRRLGAAVIRSGPGQPARQWELITRLAPTTIIGVPSFLAEVAQWGIAHGFDPAASSVRRLITIGEPGRNPDFSPNPLGRQLMESWNARLFSAYGSTEMEQAFGECEAGEGGHAHPELMWVEICDGEGRQLPDGELGEIVVTPLGVQGFPLVRFRTGDVSTLISTPCSCGWNTKRLGPIRGRLAHRLKYRGTVFYPEAVFTALARLPHAGAYVEVRADNAGADLVRVVIGRSADSPEPAEFEALLQGHLRALPQVVLRPAEEVAAKMSAHGGRKLKRFFDLRGEHVI